MCDRPVFSPRHTRLLICEGAEDEALANAFKSAKLIDDDIDVMRLGAAGDAITAGIYGLPSLLAGGRANPAFKGKTSIGIFADNDLEPSEKGPLQKFVANAVAHANASVPSWEKSLSTPTGINAKATDRDVSVTIVSPLSGDALGCLEMLLFDVMKGNGNVEKCVNALIACGKLAKWSPSKIAKAKVRAAIAISFEKKPQIQLSAVWRKAPDLIPANHPLFKDLISRISKI
jgi:hypothetical protein